MVAEAMPWVEKVQEPEPLKRARSEALEGRDIFKGKEPLVNLWREVSKPRKGGAIAAQPAGCKVDFDFLFNQWLQDRGLDTMLVRGEDKEGWAVFTYHPENPVVESRQDWEQAFHGTWWYAVWLILKSGVFLESNNRSLGHDFWEPGVYCSPSLDTGLWYARPQILFGDGVYYRVIFELRVDPAKRKRDRKRGGVQWVFPSSAVALHAVWVRSNAPPKNGEERVNGWDPELEALPLGSTALEPIVNPRQLSIDPWPHIEDEFPFDKGNNDAPPWMQSPSPGTSPASQAIRPALMNGASKGGSIRPLLQRARAATAGAAAACMALPGPCVPQARPATFWGQGGRPPCAAGAQASPWTDGWDDSSSWSSWSGAGWKDGGTWKEPSSWGGPCWQEGAKGDSSSWNGSRGEAKGSMQAGPRPVGRLAAGAVRPSGQSGGGRWGGPIKPMGAKRAFEGAEEEEATKKGRLVPPPGKAPTGGSGSALIKSLLASQEGDANEGEVARLRRWGAA